MQQLSTSSQHIQASRDGSIGWLVLNRPARRNALSAEMWAAIPPSIAALENSADIRTIVIRGAGSDAFAAGADISEFSESRSSASSGEDYERLHAAALASIRLASRPVVAMIQGYCIGGGLAIALACDLRVADGSAVFALPPARLGLAYPLDGLRDLVAAVGASNAKDLLFTARRLKAQDALRIGLINHHFADIEPDTRALCAEISAGAPLTIIHCKQAINLISQQTGHADEERVAEIAAACFDSADYAEGRAAFAAKRKPVFKGE